MGWSGPGIFIGLSAMFCILLNWKRWGEKGAPGSPPLNRTRTYPGGEVPNPITVDIVRGDADLEVVLADLMGLTKLNFNSATFSDGLPVTLRFADLVGEILTAGPTDIKAPLPFKFYI